MLSLIPKIAYIADAATRRDIASGVINDERFYVATLLSRMRDLWSQAGGLSGFTSLQPSGPFEKQYGVDGIILICFEDMYKAIGFEAKRPGFGNPRVWDKIPAGQAVSRFHRQLDTQQGLHPHGWITGGLFINELPFHVSGRVPGDSLGSSFMHWDVLFPYSTSVVAVHPHSWRSSHLAAAFASNPSECLNLEQLLLHVVTCEAGAPMSLAELKDSSAAFQEHLRSGVLTQDEPSEDPATEYALPAASSEPTNLLLHLCRQTGASSALLFDLGNNASSDVSRAEWRSARLQKLLPQNRQDTGQSAHSSRL